MDSLITIRQSLEEALQRNEMVLVVGPEAVQVEVERADGTTTTAPLYRLVADELLGAYGVTLPEQPASAGSTWLLHKVVAQILANSPAVSVEKLRRSVSATVRSLSSRAKGSRLLARLAALRAFELFICLTPDDCLVDALGQVLGVENVHVSAYAPNAGTSQPVDVAAERPGGARVFFPLGRSAAGSNLAIHEEDALEFTYKFQEEGLRRAPALLTALRTRDLLLLGCNLPDWLGRGFLRLARESRLSSAREKMEFFGADITDVSLSAFLSRFDPNASLLPWSPEDFVAELERMAPRREPQAAAAPPRSALAAPAAQRAAPTIFVSYASGDGEAARRLAAALGTLGFGDVWLDRRKLIAGDDWSDRIDEAIEKCDFFMPVLSQQANQRREGVFWEEWRKAVGRAMRVNDAFLLPVVVDVTAPALDRAGYERIFSGDTSEFRRVQLIHAPLGELSPDSMNQLRRRCELFLGVMR
jgi:TIR domain-containing protein